MWFPFSADLFPLGRRLCCCSLLGSASGSIQHLPSYCKGLWGTVTSLYVSIRKTPSGISFLMLPGSTITSVSVAAGSPEPVPPEQTDGELGADSAPQTPPAPVPAPSERRAPFRFHFCTPHSLSGRWSWSCFGNRCDSGMTSPGFCSISVSILVRRFLLPGSHSSSPGVSMLFLLLHNSPGISFQLFSPIPFISYTVVLSFPFLF